MNDIVNEAFIFAFSIHNGQLRKDGKPYIVHPFSVANTLAKNGASDELIAAGLLHDTIEDAHATPDELRKRFGDEVLRLVSFDTEDKTLPWEERKSATLSAVKTCDRQCAMLVCADKLSNIRDIASDLDKKGEAAWSIFKYGREKQEWLFKSFVTALERLSDLEMYQQFKTDVESVFDKKGE